MPREKLTVEVINHRLKSAKIRVTLRQKGGALYLRATLPPKPGSGHVGNKQYDVALNVPANDDGLRRAEQEAKNLGSLVALGKFDWSIYLKDARSQAEETPVSQLIEQFKEQYMATHVVRESTWHRHFFSVYKRLPQAQPISSAALIAVALETKTNTRNRKQTCQKLQKLAEFAGIEIDLLQYQGNYSQSRVERRDLPSDSDIAENRDRIPNKAWQWIYGMIAAFGCRPHEAWLCEFGKSPYELKILRGKTGPRITRALYPDWVDEWDLTNVQKPRVKLSSAEDYFEYGRRTNRQFTRYEIPFVPYDLRHAFAVRGSTVFNLPTATMASLMGHDPVVFLTIYQRWIKNSQHQQVYENLVINKGKLDPRHAD